ncbi:hypothetical protein ASD45_19135 [Pseudolabrys sp. Root1462]|uniref:hypothetical protein n=1 Tax=Pseudolabrys sp. Root1462 TaxID=1736466 RepID=UPI0007028C2C|nr:hypothetical protein [Pseudolabrys sp. Root1462]KQY98095.1 hypothetical protein ASD45_19135 [Pseudolabrys sp. Root1462]
MTKSATDNSATFVGLAPKHGWDHAVDFYPAQEIVREYSIPDDDHSAVPAVEAMAKRVREYGIHTHLLADWILELLKPTKSKDWLLAVLISAYRKLKEVPGRRSAFKPEVFPDDDEFDFEPKKPDPITYDQLRLPAMLDHVEACLRAAGTDIFQMEGRLVHTYSVEADSADDDAVRRKAGALIVNDVAPLRLLEYTIEHVPFIKAGKKGVLTPYAPPISLANHYLAREDKWRLPMLRGVIEIPTLRQDGTLVVEDGYDEESGLLLNMRGVEFPTIKDEPTEAEAKAALATLKTVIKDFPFVADENGHSPSRSVMLSLILTALVRRSLPSAPMHGFRAPTMGTGKTLAVNVASMIATGREITAMSQGPNEEEDEKRLFSVLLKGDPMVLIDNVTRPISGNALCTVLTEDTWQSRFLGESKNKTVRTNATFAASGNNMTFKGDMTTRALLCCLDAGLEKPETRRFDVDLKVEVPKRRPELVVAGITVLRAFVVAGRPGLSRLVPFGRFEHWSNLVRGALVWLGEADPVASRELIARDDPERGDLGALIAAIADCTFGPFTAGDIVKAAEDDYDSPLRDAMESAIPGYNKKSVSSYLQKYQGRIVDGLKIKGWFSTRGKRWQFQIVPATKDG